MPEILDPAVEGNGSMIFKLDYMGVNLQNLPSRLVEPPVLHRSRFQERRYL